jgi:hypothetical protein
MTATMPPIATSARLADMPVLPRPHQPFLARSFVAAQPVTARELAVQVHAFAKAKLAEVYPQATGQDLEELLQAAAGQVEVERQAEHAAELAKAIMQREAAEAARRAKGTLDDPEVQASREHLKRLTSAALQLVLQADQLTPIQAVAAKSLLLERANEALTKATGSTPSAQPATAAA